ncbi:hypothetical protein BOTBODRAFT_178020 [Botryobasidium botryosum FD-172 SS1]|uniref:Zn(2)-C6 fungal-type domain-containing protein n=1 Tax=Botryobasidium botryosum (strain FD-172 SS1) TaxID=930990 RepID=A0A067M426_BOTB1|nr:hypothetical protein BOTBODRAFT_178020 [Botryobasidium botryosum FD-172 SS1]
MAGPPNRPTDYPPYYLPPPSSSGQHPNSIPIDPNLAVYQSNQPHPSHYYPFPNPAGPSQSPSGISDSTADSVFTPSSAVAHGNSVDPSAVESPPKAPGKRLPKDQGGSNGAAGPSRKKAKKDDDVDNGNGDAESPATPAEKPKPTRGSRACTVCRRLKMKCVGAEQGPPCKRCQTGNHECIFEESNRGKRSSKKHEMLTKSLRKMEKTLDTVLRSLSNPHAQALATGMVSRSPSPGAGSGGGSDDEGDDASPRRASSSVALAKHSQQISGQSPAAPLSIPTPSSLAGPSDGRTSPKLHSLPDNALNPLGLLAEASLANQRDRQHSGAQPPSDAKGGDAPANADVGVASATYFKPGPMSLLPLRRLYIERQLQPEMLNFVSTEEVIALFKIYFDRMNLHCALLDPEFHTPSLVCSRSPFLLTTICAISSKFYSERTDLHAKLNKLVKKLSFSVPEQGFKSVEIVQAYLLLSLWGCGPVERFEQDKTWLLLGLAIRVATDLNLHRKTVIPREDTPEWRSRDKELRNRERTWLLCFNLDRSFSAQMGKPHSIKEDFIIRNVSQWWKVPEAIPGDVGLAGYVEMQRLLSRSLDFLYSGTSTASGLQTDCDYMLVIKTIETQLEAWQTEWDFGRKAHLNGTTDSNFVHNELTRYRAFVGKFYYNYAVLVVNSFGLQNAIERSPIDIGHFFGRCHSSATACALIMRDELGAKGYLRYAPDSHFVLGSYAVLTLLKLIRPEFQAYIPGEQKTVALVKDMADLLENIAANPFHTPALYSTFLRALLAARVDPSSRIGSPRPPNSGAPSTSNEPSSAVATPQNYPTLPDNGASSHQDESSLGLKMFAPMGDGAFSSSDFMMPGGANEMVDMSTFPPTMAPPQDPAQQGNGGGEGAGNGEQPLGMTIDNIFSSGFWDSVLIPGYSTTLDGLSGGFIYGAGGSGFITPRRGSPEPVGGLVSPPIGEVAPLREK